MIVKVVWEDAWSFDEWQPRSQGIRLPLFKNITYGELIARRRDRYIIARSTGERDDGGPKVEGVMAIPRGCITDVGILEL